MIYFEMSVSGERLRRRHLASLTGGQMVMLNLEELRAMGRFSYEVVVSEEDDNKIYAYEYEQNRNAYLLMVPAPFLRPHRNRTNRFVDLLCLAAQTVSVPIHSPLPEHVRLLLHHHCISSRAKTGSSLCKLYLEGDCWVTYLDLVTFQAVQIEGKDPLNLLAMKKSNSYQFCLAHFKEHLLPQLYANAEESLSVEEALETVISEVAEWYQSLTCSERFQPLYQRMGEQNHSLRELRREMQEAAMARQVTTVGDDEYEEIIHNEMASIVRQEMEKHDLAALPPTEQQHLLRGMLEQLLETLRQYKFEVDDSKYLFLAHHLLAKAYSLQQHGQEVLANENAELRRELGEREAEIEKLKKELSAFKEAKEAEKKRLPELTIITEEREEGKAKDNPSRGKETPKLSLTIKDIKQPLQPLQLNSPSLKQTAAKAKEKQTTAEKLRKTEGRSSGKNLRIK